MRFLLAACLFTLSVAQAPPAQAQARPDGSPIKPAPGWQPPRPGGAASSQAPAASRPRLRSDTSAADQDSFYDSANPAFAQLQKADQALAGMPLDRAGFIDWMRMLDDGQISPRDSLSGAGRAQALDLDILLKNTRQMPWVRFPHSSHTRWLDCANCHPSPFEQRAGAARITMESIFRGQWCGMCHDRVAFITHLACDRCHSVSNPTAAPAQ